MAEKISLRLNDRSWPDGDDDKVKAMTMEECCNGTVSKIADTDSVKSLNGYVQTASKHKEILFGIDATPPWYLVIAYALQQVALMLGGPIGASFIIHSSVCAGSDHAALAKLISISFFMSGLCTILQVTFGVRLPILQGSNATCVAVLITMRTSSHWPCDEGSQQQPLRNVSSVNGTNESVIQRQEEVWKARLNEASNGVMLAAVVEVLLGCTGLIGVLIRFIGPLTLCPSLSLIGLSVSGVIAQKCQDHWGVVALTVSTFVLSSSVLKEVGVPLPAWSKSRRLHTKRYPLFRLFPQALAIVVGCITCVLLTETGLLPSDPSQRGYLARTDIKMGFISQQDWIFIPRPGMWGSPSFGAAMFVGMLVATVTSILESIGDYYAAAQACVVPPPPNHAVNRGITVEGLGAMLSGLLGAAHATTSYSTPTAMIRITGMASRRTYQCAGVVIMLAGLVGKFGAVLSCIPVPVLGAVTLSGFGMIISLGLSYLRHVDLCSSRNLVVLAISFSAGMAIPAWMNNNAGVINTGSERADQMLSILLSTHMFIGGVLGCFLDNLIPGTAEERGIAAQREFHEEDLSKRDHEHHSDVMSDVYDLPLAGRRRTGTASRLCRYVPFMPCYEDLDVTGLLQRALNRRRQPSSHSV